jgi:hypothetical protein
MFHSHAMRTSYLMKHDISNKRYRLQGGSCFTVHSWFGRKCTLPKNIYCKPPPSSLNLTFYFNYLVCETIGTAATPGLLRQPRVTVKMIVEKQMECRLTEETEVLLGENLPQRHFCPSQNPTWPDPDLNPGRRDGKPATNRLSYGVAIKSNLLSSDCSRP